MIREGDLGFCEAYLEGWWTTPDLQAFMDLVHPATMPFITAFPAWPSLRAFENLRHALRATRGRRPPQHRASLRSGQ